MFFCCIRCSVVLFLISIKLYEKVALFRLRDTREGWPLLTVGTEVNGEGTKWVLFVVRARRAVTRDFYLALAALVSPVHFFFPRRTLFQFMCLYRPATWAGSRAGPPVSECVSPLGFNFFCSFKYFRKVLAITVLFSPFPVLFHLSNNLCSLVYSLT